MNDIKELLDYHANLKNCDENLFASADPLQVARKFSNVQISLICALFAYGNANLIVKFLHSLDFSLLDANDEIIKKELKNHKYRFQNSEDVAQIFITIKRLKNEIDIEQILVNSLENSGEMVDAINTLIVKLYLLNSYKSPGYEFYFGRNFSTRPTSPYKRYNMYLRWMVRDSDIDMGLFKKIDKRNLLIPLDVHTHKVSLKLGLITRKSYDFEAVRALTKRLCEFDASDPIKYDFALYRLGQSKEIEELNLRRFDGI